MKLKIVFATATAVGLLMASGAALADSNNATVVQTGDGNTALAQQSGNQNWLGVPNSLTGYGHVIQDGDRNHLSVDQNGNGNTVAHFTGGTIAGFPSGNVLQYGNENSIDINQTDTSNTVWGIKQQSIDGSAATNKLVILQDTGGAGGYSQQTVGYVTQTNDLANVTSASESNTVDVLQRGSGYGSGNAFRSANQSGHGNSQDIDQLGTKNLILDVTQNGAGNQATVFMSGDQNLVAELRQDLVGGGAGDVAIVHIVGNRNGTGVGGSYTPYGASPGSIYTTAPRLITDPMTGPASTVSGALQGQILQTGGSNNYFSYFVTGDYNLYGFNQNGNGNHIGGTVTGDSHQAAISEDGDGNIVDFLQTGAGNNMGVWIDGNDNHLNIKQQQTGASGNVMSVSISGNDNNNYPITSALTGDALTAKGAAVADVGLFSQGDLLQNGSNNSLTLAVINSNLNAFATDQHGANNSITHTISGGNGNQIVVAQIGDSNSSVTSQTGSGNNIGVTQ